MHASGDATTWAAARPVRTRGRRRRADAGMSVPQRGGRGRRSHAGRRAHRPPAQARLRRWPHPSGPRGRSSGPGDAGQPDRTALRRRICNVDLAQRPGALGAGPSDSRGPYRPGNKQPSSLTHIANRWSSNVKYYPHHDKYLTCRAVTLVGAKSEPSPPTFTLAAEVAGTLAALREGVTWLN